MIISYLKNNKVLTALLKNKIKSIDDKHWGIKMSSFGDKYMQSMTVKPQFGTISFYNECEGGIEKSVPRITDLHHEACRVMTIGDRERRIFVYHPHTHD